MKIRTGFVSNSSSSSFVAIGVTFDTKELNKIIEDAFNVKEDSDEWYDIIYEGLQDDVRILSGTDDGMPDEETSFLGHVIVGDENGYLDESIVEVGEELDSIKKEIKEKLKIDIDVKDIKIISGTMMT